MCEHEKKYIVLTQEELVDIIQATIKETVKDTLAELGVKMYPKQSGRIYRKQMINILGYRGFYEAIQKGWLHVQKHDPLKRNSRVYARIFNEDLNRYHQIEHFDPTFLYS